METNQYMEWLKGKKLSESTTYLYGLYYKRFEKHPFTQQGMDDFFATPKVNNSVSRAFIKSLLEFLGMEDAFKLPPKPTGKIKKKIVRQLSVDQIQAIRDEAYKKSKIVGFMFDFIYYGALRRSEVCKIKINSFGWSEWFNDPTQACELKIELAKGNKDRMVLIPAHVIKSFADFYMEAKKIKPDHLEDLIITLNNTPNIIFMRKTGKAMDGWNIWKMIKALSYKAIGLEIRPHELRHARATELEDKGHNIRTIQHYLGHSSPTITEVYLHTSEKRSLSKIKDQMATIKDL